MNRADVNHDLRILHGELESIRDIERRLPRRGPG